MLNGILVIMLYVFVCLASTVLIKNDYIRYANRKNCEHIDPKKKISYSVLILVAGMFTLFNMFSTWVSNGYGADRINYAYEFTGARSTTSVALDFIFRIMNLSGRNIEFAFYFTTFVCVFLTLLAYKISKIANYKVYVLLLTSEWILFTLTALKQAYACAFACLFFVFVFEDRSKRGFILSLLFAVIASMFHISGMILLPMLLLIRIRDMGRWKTFLLTALIIGFTIGMQPILLSLSGVVGRFIPAYASKINSYFGSSGADSESSVFAFIKYLPIYYVTFLGIIKKNKISQILQDYNKYLLVSVISSCLVLYSIYSYWFSRFTGIFSFPVFILYSYISSNQTYKTNKLASDLLVYGGGLTVLFRKILLIFIKWGAF